MVSKATHCRNYNELNLIGFINYDRLLALVFAGGIKTDLKMKTYYFECTVSFTEFVPEEDTYFGEESYSGIVEAKNKKQGKVDAEKRGMELFESDLGSDQFSDIKIKLETFYETYEGARAN